MSAYTDKVTEVKGYTAYTLAGMADCMSPDSLESVGAQFLGSVRDDVIERVEDITAEDFERETEDISHEIADSAVPVYTGEKWATFTDLGAYAEDVSEYAGESSDMDKLSDVALYVIAERLASAILSELAESIEEDGA